MDVISKTVFQSKCEALKDVREQINHICEQQRASSKIKNEIILAVNEACMNIIQHGYNNEPDHEFTMVISLSEHEISREKELIIQLNDQAKKVDPLEIKSRDLDDVKPGGIGVHMIHELMDSAEYVDHEGQLGNILELRKKL